MRNFFSAFFFLSVQFLSVYNRWFVMTDLVLNGWNWLIEIWFKSRFQSIHTIHFFEKSFWNNGCTTTNVNLQSAGPLGRSRELDYFNPPPLDRAHSLRSPAPSDIEYIKIDAEKTQVHFHTLLKAWRGFSLLNRTLFTGSQAVDRSKSHSRLMRWLWRNRI